VADLCVHVFASLVATFVVNKHLHLHNCLYGIEEYAPFVMTLSDLQLLFRDSWVFRFSILENYDVGQLLCDS